jgi:carbon storage regulator
MLVLTRKPGEKILIGDDIVITVLDARGESVRIGIDAPRGFKIQRDEVVRAVSEANMAASQVDTEAEDRIRRSLGALAARQSTSPEPEPEAQQSAVESNPVELRAEPVLPHPPAQH